MASKNGVTIIVAGEDKSGEVFAAVQKHLAQTQAKAKETSSSLGDMGEMLKRGLQTAGIAIGLHEVVSGFKEMITSTMEAGVQLNKLHQETGISAENLSVLKYAAQSSGVEFETVAKAGKKLAEAIHDTDAGKLAEGFKVLGISAEEVKSKGNDMYSVMALIADRFREMPDGVDKNVAAVKLFGKAGMEMIPILNQGAAALENFKSKATIFTEADIEKMEKMHKATAEMSAAWDKASLAIASGAAPALTHWFELIASGDSPMQTLKKDVLDLALAYTQLHGAVGLPGIDLSKHYVPGLPQDYYTNGTHFSTPAKPTAAKTKNSGAMTIDTGKLLDEQLYRQGDFLDAMKKAQREYEQRAQNAKDLAMQTVTPDISATIPEVPLEQLSLKPLQKDYTALRDAGEKMAHGLFDPMFNFSEKWEQRFKQMQQNLLRDVGQLAESQLFGALFGDPQGRGGRGLGGGSWEGNPNPPSGRAGLASEALGALGRAWHHGKASATSNGGVGAGAGTLPTPAAGLMQTGKGAGNGGVQVVIQNMGAPMVATATQQAASDGAEGQVIQIVLKDQQTNGPMSQGFLGLMMSAGSL